MSRKSEKKPFSHSVVGLKFLFITICSISLWGCIQPQPAQTTEMTTTEKSDAAPKAVEEKCPEVKVVQAPPSTELQDTDCNKCHDTQPTDIKTNGARHKTAIACVDCHLEHLPLGVKTIPECAMCHDSGDLDHFGLGDTSVCLGCHRNPHTPLDVTVDDVPENSKGCLTCHGDKGEEFQAFPSRHSEQNCTFCHPTKHKVINRCFTCHEKDQFHGGNASFLQFEDCLGCHKPHSPLDITYAADTPSKYCGTCHGDLFQALSNSKSKHNKLNCAYCHKERHPTVPNCTDCHNKPHSATLLTSFNEDCLKCHRDPHDLIF